VGLVLAIACSNLATLLLVSASARSTEISVRLALGATRWQLVRRLMMESFVLSMAGAAAGVALTHAGLRYLESIDLPILLKLQTDYRVLGFAIAAAALCGIGFGLTPALRAARVDVAGGLREEKGSSGSALSLTRSWFTLKNGLVTGQVAASFLLLVGAALALGILTETQERSVGYRPEGVAIVVGDPKYAGYDMPRARAVFEDLRRRIAAMPGVESALVTSELPIDGQFEKEFRVDGGGDGEVHRVEGRWAGPGYFRTMEIPVLFGRVFDERDTPESPQVIVVSEAFARAYFGTPNGVGKRIRYEDAEGKPAEIIGVAGNARSIDFVADAPRKSLYRSEAQCGVMPATIVARARRDEAALVGLMQQEVRRLHPGLPAVHAITMKRRQAMELGPFRVAVVSPGALGGLGLPLASVGF
jgi:predicted permease